MNQYVCRCCLKENPELTYKIFDATATLLTELRECTPASIKYEQNDGLPQIICDLCWLRVQEANDFRKQCLLADQELQNRYAEYKNKAVEEVLGLVEKFRQQDNEVLGFADINFPTSLCENLEDIQEFPNFAALKTAFEADSILNEQDLFNTSLDSGVFEEEFLVSKNNDFENCLESQTNNDSSSDQQSPASKLPQEKSSKRSFICTQCDKKFTRNFQLKQHLMSFHNIGNGLQYTCNICSNKFASHHSLSYHQKSVHYQEKPYSCTECDKQFVIKTQLVSHMRIHTGESKPRIFECKECGKKWPTKSDLKTHMRTHDPNMERPFKCNSCEKSFFTRGHLNSHRLVHTGEKPFSCDFCTRSYQSVGNLNNHMIRRHTKEMLQKEDCDPSEYFYRELKHKIEGDKTVLIKP